MRSVQYYLCLCVLLVYMLALTAGADPAVNRLLTQHPCLKSGGNTPETFATWANARYLLNGAMYIGEVTSLAGEVRADLFISSGEPVLAFWSATGKPVPITVALGKDAKLYAWGQETRRLNGKQQRLRALGVPLLMRNAADQYVVEALGHTLEWEFTTPAGTNPERATALLAGLPTDLAPAPLLSAVRLRLGDVQADELERQRQRVAMVMARGKVRKIEPELSALEGLLDRAIDAALGETAPLPEEHFVLVMRLLNAQLRVQELRVGVTCWQEELAPAAPLPLLERMNLMNGLEQMLGLAAPSGQLRGRPRSVKYIRQAQQALHLATAGPAPRERRQLDTLRRRIPRVLAAEPLTASSLIISAHGESTDKKTSLVLRLRNVSGEEATGVLEVVWAERQVSERFRVVPGGQAELVYPVQLAPGALVLLHIAGALDDGTPLAPSIVSFGTLTP